MPVVCILNQKGGVGKTATCFHLSGTLAQLGRRVLLVDNDPQASLTQGFLDPDGMRELAPSTTITAILAGEDPLPSHVIRTVRPGIDLVPGSESATSYNLPDPHLLDVSHQNYLRSFLGDVAGSYDLVLIDCPPNLCLCSWAALVASDHLVIPLCPEDSGAQGIHTVLRSVYRVQAGPNPGLNLAGYLITRVHPRTGLHQAFEATLRDLYRDDVFAVTIPHRIDYPEGMTARRPVVFNKPRGAAAKDMKTLAQELEGRLVLRAKGVA